MDTVQPNIVTSEFTNDLDNPQSSTNSENCPTGNSLTSVSPISEKLPSNSLPLNNQILENFEKWVTSMDGGCQTKETAYQSRLVMTNMITFIGLANIITPNVVNEYFTKRDDLIAAIINVYLRYLSDFLLYVHQEYPDTYTIDKYHLMNERISR